MTLFDQTAMLPDTAGETTKSDTGVNVTHLKNLQAWLMDGANHSAASLYRVLHRSHHDGCRSCIQACTIYPSIVVAAAYRPEGFLQYALNCKYCFLLHTDLTPSCITRHQMVGAACKSQCLVHHKLSQKLSVSCNMHRGRDFFSWYNNSGLEGKPSVHWFVLARHSYLKLALNFSCIVSCNKCVLEMTLLISRNAVPCVCFWFHCSCNKCVRELSALPRNAVICACIIAWAKFKTGQSQAVGCCSSCWRWHVCDVQSGQHQLKSKSTAEAWDRFASYIELKIKTGQS